MKSNSQGRKKGAEQAKPIDEAGFISHLKIDEKCEIDVILG